MDVGLLGRRWLGKIEIEIKPLLSRVVPSHVLKVGKDGGTVNSLIGSKKARGGSVYICAGFLRHGGYIRRVLEAIFTGK